MVSSHDRPQSEEADRKVCHQRARPDRDSAAGCRRRRDPHGRCHIGMDSPGSHRCVGRQQGNNQGAVSMVSGTQGIPLLDTYRKSGIVETTGFCEKSRFSATTSIFEKTVVVWLCLVTSTLLVSPARAQKSN